MTSIKLQGFYSIVTIVTYTVLLQPSTQADPLGVKNVTNLTTSEANTTTEDPFALQVEDDVDVVQSDINNVLVSLFTGHTTTDESTSRTTFLSTKETEIQSSSSSYISTDREYTTDQLQDISSVRSTDITQTTSPPDISTSSKSDLSTAREYLSSSVQIETTSGMQLDTTELETTLPPFTSSISSLTTLESDRISTELTSSFLSTQTSESFISSQSLGSSEIYVTTTEIQSSESTSIIPSSETETTESVLTSQASSSDGGLGSTTSSPSSLPPDFEMTSSQSVTTPDFEFTTEVVSPGETSQNLPEDTTVFTSIAPTQITTVVDTTSEEPISQSTGITAFTSDVSSISESTQETTESETDVTSIPDALTSQFTETQTVRVSTPDFEFTTEIIDTTSDSSVLVSDITTLDTSSSQTSDIQTTMSFISTDITSERMTSEESKSSTQNTDYTFVSSEEPDTTSLFDNITTDQPVTSEVYSTEIISNGTSSVTVFTDSDSTSEPSMGPTTLADTDITNTEDTISTGTYSSTFSTQGDVDSTAIVTSTASYSSDTVPETTLSTNYVSNTLSTVTLFDRTVTGTSDIIPRSTGVLSTHGDTDISTSDSRINTQPTTQSVSVTTSTSSTREELSTSVGDFETTERSTDDVITGYVTTEASNDDPAGVNLALVIPLSFLAGILLIGLIVMVILAINKKRGSYSFAKDYERHENSLDNPLYETAFRNPVLMYDNDINDVHDDFKQTSTFNGGHLEIS